jgi:hypothetical protein
LTASQTNLSQNAVTIHEDGSIEGHTDEALRTIRILGLDSPEHVAWRRQIIEIIELAWASGKTGESDIYRTMMGYPNDLPDLSKSSPRSNSRPEGIHESAFARRQRGELPDVY